MASKAKAPKDMERPAAKAKTAKDSSATIGCEAKLWLTTDKLRNNMDAVEYKHVVLGLIFLKYISDTFEEHRAKVLAGKGDYAGANAEDPDEYKAENVFLAPAATPWSHLQASAKQPTIGKTVDDAIVAIERDNPRLKGVLPKDYARPALDKHRLGELIDLICGIEVGERAPSPQPSPSGTKFQNGDTLLARITPCLENGKTGYVDFLADGQVGWGSNEYIVLAPKPPLASQFGYLRDTLLPKLLSGGVSVAKIEKEVAA